MALPWSPCCTGAVAQVKRPQGPMRPIAKSDDCKVTRAGVGLEASDARGGPDDRDDTPALKPKDMPDLSRFDWEDALRLEDELTEDERMMRDAARAYAAEKLQPRIIAGLSRRGDRSCDLRRDGRDGPAGRHHPRGIRRLGRGYVTYGLIAREVERVDSGYRSMMSVQSSLVMYPIYAYGSEEQRQKYLPEPRRRRMDRLLRPDRTRCRLRPGGDEDRRDEDRRRLSA